MTSEIPHIIKRSDALPQPGVALASLPLFSSLRPSSELLPQTLYTL